MFTSKHGVMISSSEIDQVDWVFVTLIGVACVVIEYRSCESGHKLVKGRCPRTVEVVVLFAIL